MSKKLSQKEIGKIIGYALCLTSSLNNAHRSDYDTIFKQAIKDGFTWKEFKKYAELDYKIWLSYGLEEIE